MAAESMSDGPIPRRELGLDSSASRHDKAPPRMSRSRGPDGCQPHSSNPTASTRRSTPTSRSSTREMERICERIWVYCGHESQVPKPGDYYAVHDRPPADDHGPPARRQRAGALQPLPAPRRQVVGNRKGNTGSAFVCSYHAWSFHLDGSVRAIPLAKGYEGTRMTQGQPRLRHEARRARRQLPRLRVREPRRPTGPSLSEFLGEAKIAFDDMCDRSPLGEVEVVPICHRVIQHSNWKFFMENQLDALHPSVTHQSTGISAGRGREAPQGREGRGAALLPLPLDLRVELRASGTACRRSTSRTATASSRPTWACGRATPTRSSTRRC